MAIDKIEKIGGPYAELLGGTLVGIARHLVEHGVTGPNAVRLSAAAVIGGAFGRQPLLDLGIPLRTVQRWEAEAREALSGSNVDIPPVDAMNQMLRLMGLPLRVVSDE